MRNWKMPYPLRSRGYGEGGKQLILIKVHTDLDSVGCWDFESGIPTSEDKNALTLQNWYTGSAMTRLGTILPQHYKVYTIEKTREIGIFVDAILFVVSPTYDQFLADGIPRPFEHCQRYDFYQILHGTKSASLAKCRNLPQGKHKLRYTETDATSSTSSTSSEIDSSRTPVTSTYEFLKRLRRGTDTWTGRTKSKTTDVPTQERATSSHSQEMEQSCTEFSTLSETSKTTPFRKRQPRVNNNPVETVTPSRDTNRNSRSMTSRGTDVSNYPDISESVNFLEEIKANKDILSECIRTKRAIAKNGQSMSTFPSTTDFNSNDIPKTKASGDVETNQEKHTSSQKRSINGHLSKGTTYFYHTLRPRHCTVTDTI